MDKNYYILIDGIEIPVSEEIYREYYQPVWREAWRANTRSRKEYSYERMIEDGMQIADPEKLIEEIVADKLMLDKLFLALEMLSEDERDIIQYLFYDERTERDIASEFQIAQQTLHKKKNRILKKLRHLIENK